jgi:hypothetical protein
MSSNEVIAHEATAHVLTKSAIAVAVRKIIGRVGFHGHPTQERVAQRLQVFALAAAKFALIDEGMAVPVMSIKDWRQRFANENIDRLRRCLASDSFVDRFVEGLLKDRKCDVGSSPDVVREAFGHVFNVVTQVAVFKSKALNPALLVPRSFLPFVRLASADS